MIDLTNTRAQLEQACARMAAVNAPQLPLMRAAADGRIVLAWAYHPAAAFGFQHIKHEKRPAVVLIGDDPEPERASLGPIGWTMAVKLRRWATAVIVHGGDGTPDHYREAVRGALVTGRCVMVETASRHADTWAQFFRCPSTLVIKPAPHAGPHPCVGAEVVH